LEKTYPLTIERIIMDKENKSKFRITFSEEVTYEVMIKAKDKAEATNIFNTPEYWEENPVSSTKEISRDWLDIKDITYEGIDG
jgi:hypothetical protein